LEKKQGELTTKAITRLARRSSVTILPRVLSKNRWFQFKSGISFPPILW